MVVEVEDMVRCSDVVVGIVWLVEDIVWFPLIKVVVPLPGGEVTVVLHLCQ